VIFAPNMSYWAAAYGGAGSIADNAFTGAANTNSQIFGLATGLDYRWSPNTVIGLALGGGGTAWQLGQGQGNGSSGMFQLGTYAVTHMGQAYVSSATAYSLQEVTTNRVVTLAGSDSLQGDFPADVFSGRIEGGYRLPYGGFAVTPYGAVQTQAMLMPAYSEFAVAGSPQFALSYAGRTVTDTRTEVGLWLDSDTWMEKGVKIYGRIAWAHDFTNDGISTAFFQSLPGSAFLVNTARPANDGALVTAGFDYKLQGGWFVTAKFDGEFSSTTAIFGGSAALRYQW
jgi:uncharacterized protein with beta-barrel porin domain